MLVHGPGFSFTSGANTEDKLIMDYEFIKTYYSNNGQNAQLFTILTNATNVLVVMPDPVMFAAGVIMEYHEFIESLHSDKTTRDILKNHTTVEAFFSPEAVDPVADTAE